jgi:phenylalanyl-tRNA synthetase beta chain
MLITYKWIQDYVEIPWTADVLATKLTDVGMEVKSLTPHPRDKEDYLIEIEVTPNRPDCLCFIGLAREVSAITGNPLKFPKMDYPEETTPASKLASVEIKDPDLCLRYAGRVIRGIKIGPSPEWMVKRLEAIGVRSINNVVDITNYVLMEFGHPLHAFDLNFLENKQIIVRRAAKDEKMVTLDGQERQLDTERLVIADAKRPVALAGVMGGANSEVLDTTVDLLIESAYFNPISIRRTSKKLGLRSESSYRFERGTNPETLVNAMNRAVALVVELAGGRVAAGMLDVYPQPEEPTVISLRISRVNNVLGTKLAKKFIHTIFERLGCTIKSSSNDVSFVQVPIFRKDLLREIDLIEEVARVNGLDKAPITAPIITSQPNLPYPQWKMERTAQDILVNMGFWESYNYSFIHSEEWGGLGFNKDLMIPLRNPMSAEQDVLRCSLMPNLLKTIARNMDQGQDIVRVFEIGRVMQKNTKGRFHEQTCLSLAGSGKFSGATWEEKGVSIDFYGFKGLIEYLFVKFEIPAPDFKPLDSFMFRPGYAASIEFNGICLGEVGQIKPDIAKKLGVDKEVIYLELVLENLQPLTKTMIGYKALPKYPFMQRDISLLVPASVTSRDIITAVEAIKNPILESVSLFDLYSGERVPKGYRSMSYRMIYRHTERTLQESEVEQCHQVMLQQLIQQFNVQLRTT